MDKKFLKIAVTPDYIYPGEGEVIQEMLSEGGFDFIHLRKPGVTTAEIEDLIKTIDSPFRERLTLHDCFELADRYGIGGIHLNKRNPHPPEGWRGRISASCHSPEECLNKGNLDYVTLSPIFPAISKPGYTPSFNSDDVRKLLETPHRPAVIALGGITPDKFTFLRETGFDGCAMLGAAWRREIVPSKFRLQFITHPRSVEDAIRQTNDALQGGCRWIQLRWKEASDKEYVEAAEKIHLLCRQHDSVFLLNDRVHLVGKTDADGVHIGKNDMPLKEARALLGPHRIIGRTANTLRDVEEGILGGADYIGMGPFRFTNTKKNLSPILGAEGYRAATDYLKHNHMTLPIVAIGGITGVDIPEILSTGVDGIAVSGVIASSDDPQKTTHNLCKIIDSLKQL